MPRSVASRSEHSQNTNPLSLCYIPTGSVVVDHSIIAAVVAKGAPWRLLRGRLMVAPAIWYLEYKTEKQRFV